MDKSKKVHLGRVRLTIHQGDPQLVGRSARRQALAVSVVFQPSRAWSCALGFLKMHPGSDPHRARRNGETKKNNGKKISCLTLAIPNIPFLSIFYHTFVLKGVLVLHYDYLPHFTPQNGRPCNFTLTKTSSNAIQV